MKQNSPANRRRQHPARADQFSFARLGGLWSRKDRTSGRTARRSVIEQVEPRVVLAGSPLVISEFMASNDTTLPDDTGVFSDWIEIHNTTASPVNLQNWRLTDDPAHLAYWSFPNQMLGADGYLVVFATGTSQTVGELHANFKLNADADYLALLDPAGTTIATEFAPQFPEQVSDVSYGLSADLATRGYFLNPTPGAVNVGAPVNEAPHQILINEIMYHPLGENDAEEYIELYNRGTDAVNLAGWKLSNGVKFTFPNVTIGAGQYLAVAANLATFATKHPGVTNVVGPWVGVLDNGGETIRLEDNSATTIDSVTFSDEGDWAVRARGPLDHGHQGWIWSTGADGSGNSLELVNSLLSNNSGQNWAPSTAVGGSAGVVNSEAAANVAPLVLDVTQTPLIPRATDEVTVTARVLDELATGVTASLRWRVDGQPNFLTAPMFDDGAHGDGLAGDRVFGATLGVQPNGTVVEYYVQAADSGARTRTWPAPVLPTNTQLANLLYQVDNTFNPATAWVPGSQPIYRVIMTNAERLELLDIGDAEGSPFNDPNAESNSDARMNATFISIDGTGAEVRYQAGVRDRGHNSRIGPPNNYHIDFAHDNPWNGLTSINLNSRYGHSQVIGSVVYQLADLAAGDTVAAQVRINGANLATTAPNPNVLYGSYALVEEPGGGFVKKHFPLDSQGNLYSAFRIDGGGQQAEMQYEGPLASSYQDTYFKQTNQEVNNWSDLIHMTDVLNNAPAATYFQEVSQVVDIAQWVRFLALDSLLNNQETGLNNGLGDDYVLYSGVTDPRFQLLPHDLDTVMNLGSVAGPANYSIFQSANVAGLGRFLSDPTVKQMYFQAFLDLIANVFNPEKLNPLIDLTLGDYVPAATVAAAKQFVVDRTAGVLAQIPQTFSVVSALPLTSGYRKTTVGTTALTGTANVATTGSVLVNGVAATWNQQTGAWSASGIVLNPGVNRVQVEAFSEINGGGKVVNSSFVDVWYDTSGASNTAFSVPRGSVWKYKDDGSNQGTNWRAAAFNDSTWLSGPGELGYGETDQVTPTGFIDTDPGTAGVQVNATTYFRHTFTIPAGQTATFTQVTINLRYDDGASVFLNGTEIYRSVELPGVVGDNTVLFNTYADAAGTAENKEVVYTLTAAQRALLHDGANTIAVEVHQHDVDSSDISFDMGLDATGAVVGTGSGTVVTGTLPAGTTTWSPENGPYKMTGDFTVPAGATLVIEPGTSVFINPGVHWLVRGQLLAEGTQYNQVRITRTPGSTGNWFGLKFEQSPADNRLTYVIIEWAGELISAGNSTGMIWNNNGSNLTIDHSTLDHADLRRIRSQNSGLIVRNSLFAELFPGNTPPLTDNLSEHIWGAIGTGSQFIIENNVFGKLKGHNDAIDFDSGKRGVNPIQQILNNTFLGGGDDALDMEGDAHIEGNLFMNFVKDQYNTSQGNSNGLSAGKGFEYWLVRNTYSNVEQVSTVKQDSFIHFINNTVINSLPNTFNFIPPDDPVPGRGGVFEGNIFIDSPAPMGTRPPSGNITFNYNILTPVPGGNDQAGLGLGNIVEDPRIVDQATHDVRLRPGSPALGSGLNGLDRGAVIPDGASISGEPPVETARTTATLIVGGPDILGYKYRVNGGPWSAEFPVATPIVLSGLTDGTYTVDVIGKDDAYAWQSEATPTHSKTWTVSTAAMHLHINEILTSNVNTLNFNNTHPDLIELHNSGASAVVLTGMSISDTATNPRKFVFPAGTSIPAGQYLVLYADSNPSVAGELHLGFAIDSEGDDLSLYNTLASGGALLDSVEFGVQVRDLSLGRIGQDLHWGLTTPTFGAANVAVRTGDPATLKINEWFTTGSYTIGGQVFNQDFIELYNPDFLPVPLAGLYLSDDPVGEPLKHQIAPLSFIGSGFRGFTAFIADNNPLSGPDHLNFDLASDVGWIGLSNTDGTEIDRVFYGPQTDGVSYGRVPNGSDNFEFITPPSPAVDSTPPSVPTGLIFTLLSATKNDLSWNASTDPETGIGGYRIYRDGVPIGTSATTTFSDTTVTAGVYSYQVSALNGDGVESGLSVAIGTDQDNSPPTVPANLTGTIVSATRIDLAWTASTDPQSGVKLYTIYRNGVFLATSTTNSYSDTTLPAGSVGYQVSATNNDNIESAKGALLNLSRFQDGVGGYLGTRDAWIDESAINGNNNGATVRIDGQGAGLLENRALIGWDLSSIPAGTTISGVSITLNVTNASNGEHYQLYALKRDWNEAQATWNIPQTGADWQTNGAEGANDRGTVAFTDIFTAAATGKFIYNLNAAGVALVQQWINNPGTNFGFLIANNDPAVADAMLFDSSEATTAANRPQISLTYIVADPTPPTVPAGIVITDNGATEINLSWTPSVDPQSAVLNYRVYRDNVLIGSPTTTIFTDVNAQLGTTYSYQVSAVNTSAQESARSAAVTHTIEQPLTGYSLTLETRGSYLPGVPLLVQVEITGADGRPARDVWDAFVQISSSNPNVTLSTNQIQLRNGLGSALVTINGTATFGLIASSGDIQTSRTINTLAGQPQTNVSGTLSDGDVSWTGIIHVTGDVTVPANTTLTVQPGTLVLIDGTAAVGSTTGFDINVIGTMKSMGTTAQPVTFTATNPARPWGEIRHSTSQPSTYAYTQITRAGHSPLGGGHANSGPAFHPINSTVSFDHVSISDIAGKTMLTTGGNLTILDSHFSRSVMGPELLSNTGLDMQNTWMTEMLGIYHEGGERNDNDGIYLHPATGKTISIKGGVVALVDDDGIDTLGAVVTIDDVIVRDAVNPLEDSKGISVNGGATTITRTLIVNTKEGISTKDNGGAGGARTTVDHTTVLQTPLGISQVGASGSDVRVTVNNSIIRGTDSVQAEVPGFMTITYSDLGEAWPGTGNINADPLFVNTVKHDFHLAAGSPAINTGDPASPLDSDGSRTDMGVYPRLLTAPVTVAGRHVFYNESMYDGNNAAANAADDAAIAPNKSALLPGGTATFANYTSYSRGLNGIMVDFDELLTTPTANDFTFRVGNNDTPSGWSLAPAPVSVSMRALPGPGTHSRVSIIWADGAIQGQWLQVTVKTTTGVAAPDVFYFGNAIGESGNSATEANVDANDEVAARNNPHTFVNPATITDNYDFNRDGFVNAADQILARSNARTFANSLTLIHPTGLQALTASMAPSDSLAVAAALASENSSSSGEAFDLLPGEVSYQSGAAPLAAADPGYEALIAAVDLEHQSKLDHSHAGDGLLGELDLDLLELLSGESRLK